MGQTLSNNGIQQGEIINAQHVSQSVDALTGVTDYDITVKGTIAVKNSSGAQTFKLDGNNFNESESNTFLVRNTDGTVGFRTGGAIGPQGPQGTTGAQGPQGNTGLQGTGGTSGTSGTSGQAGTGGGVVVPPINGTNGTSGSSGVRGANGGFFSCLFGGAGGGAPSNGRFKVDTWGTPTKILIDYSVSGDDTASTVNNIFSTLTTLVGSYQNTYIRLLGKNDPTKFLYAKITNVIDRGGYFEFQLQNVQLSTIPNVDDDIFTFEISGTGGDNGPQGTHGTSGTSGENGASDPTIIQTTVGFTISKELDNQFQCQVPASIPLGTGDVGFSGGGGGDSVNANDVSSILINKKDKGGTSRGSAVTQRLKHFDVARITLKDSSASTSEFSFINVLNVGTFDDGYIQLSGVNKESGGGTFNNNSNLEQWRTSKGIFVQELKPNQYERLYLNDGNTGEDGRFCLVGLKDGIVGYNTTGEFKPGQRTTVEIKAGGRTVELQVLRGTGTGYNNGSTDPYVTNNSDRQGLGSLNPGKRAIIDLVYYQSQDGSRYGLIPTAIALNLD